MALNAPQFSVPNARPRYNGTGAKIAERLVLVPDTTVDRGVRAPTLNELVVAVAGVTTKPVDIGADGALAATPGDQAVALLNGTCAKGDALGVSVASSKLGWVQKFIGGTDMIVGYALAAGVDGDAVPFTFAPQPARNEQYGSAVLVAGTVTVTISSMAVLATSRVFTNLAVHGGTAGARYLATVTAGAAGVGTITLSARDAAGALVSTDTSTLNYLIKA
jgi:hypothetical protein